MCNEWIMCSSGIYPPEDEDGESTEVLILNRWGDMHLAYYCPATDTVGYRAEHWWHGCMEMSLPSNNVICWRHKPAPPPGLEC